MALFGNATTIIIGDKTNNFSLMSAAVTTVLPTTTTIELETQNTNSSIMMAANVSHEALTPPDLMNSAPAQIFFGVLYALIFVVGITGNVLVCYVVFRNKAMQTVTNYFITNLALSDILLCILAVPFTPLYTFLGRWVFGSPLCHIVPYAQGCSVYISTLTLTAVAIDRFFVIVYPFQPRMKLSVCIGIIVSIWCFALLVTLPYGLYMRIQEDRGDNYCEENWPELTDVKIIFSICTTLLQFAIPFLVITFCYVCVSIKLNDRAKAKPGSKTSKREEADRDRKKRTNRMLIAMVAVFGISWMPLNLYNILADLKVESSSYSLLIFFVTHAVAVSSTCYNPFLYAWLNENFRKEFIQILPCIFRALTPLNGGSSGAPGPNTGSTRNNNHNRSLRRCMGPTSTYDPERLVDHNTQPKKQAIVSGNASDGELRLLGDGGGGGSGSNNHNSGSSSLNNNCDMGDKRLTQRPAQQKDSVLGGLCSKMAGNVLSKRTRDQQASDSLSPAHFPLVDPISSCTSSSCATTSSIISGPHHQTSSSKANTVCQLSPAHTSVDTTVITATHSDINGMCGMLETHFEETPQPSTIQSVALDGAVPHV